MRVLVVCGGSSSERDISILSGRAVGDALLRAGHAVSYFDPGDDLHFDLLRNMILDIDVVFPVLHGKGGEDGQIQVVLEALGVPFVGSGSEASRQCFDKAETLRTIHQAGVVAPMTDYIPFKKLKRHPLIKSPFVLKPNSEGSSVDTFLIRDVKKLRTENFKPLFDKYGSMLIETLVDGIELTVGVVDHNILPVVEIIPPKGGTFDFVNKYNGATQELCPAEHIPPEIQKYAQQVALHVHRLMKCRDLSRSDFIWGKDGNVYFLEINTLPGMTPQSLLPKAAMGAGITMPDLVDRLVQLAHARKG